MLEHLTQAQERILVEVADEYIRALTEPDPYNPETVNGWLAVAYRCCGLPKPDRVYVVDSPFAAYALATKMTSSDVTSLDGVGVCDSSWVARYDTFRRLGELSDEEAADVMSLRGFLRCAWDHILLDECAVVVRRPTVLSLDEDGLLHSAEGPALAWADGNEEYAHHGTWISRKIALEPRSHNRSEYLGIANTEERRALCERAGWNWVAELLGATVADSWTDQVTGLSYELLAYDGGKLLRKQSPKLKDGSQPWYVEPVHETLRTARAARKWQATSLSPGECEQDPDLVFGVEA